MVEKPPRTGAKPQVTGQSPRRSANANANYTAPPSPPSPRIKGTHCANPSAMLLRGLRTGTR